MIRNNKKGRLQSKLENIKLDLGTYKILLHFHNHSEPFVIHFDKPARRFYFSLIALIVTEMKSLDKQDFIYIRKHENTLKLLDNALAGKYTSKTASGMWDKVRKAWRYTLPDLETGTHFKITDRDLISPYEKGGKYRYECSDHECDIWANLFGYDESNPWRFKFAIDSAFLSLNDISVTLGDLRDNSAWKEFLKSLSTQPKAVNTEKKAVPRWWKKTAFALATALIVGATTFGIWNFYIRPAPPMTKRELPDKPSIAVLPFKNLSEDPKQEYFSDGITDTLITDLSKISGLFIIASNSVFTYKGKPVKIVQVGRDLNVRYVMEGSVQKAGNQVRINAQLIDAKTGGHLWAERYDGKMDDIFALQDKITRKIISALALKLTTSQQKALANKGTENIQAYDSFLKGWQGYRLMTKAGFADAKLHLEKAVELDPEFTRAYAALAVLYEKGVRTASPELRAGLGLTSRKALYAAWNKPELLLNKAMKKPTALALGLMSQFYLFRYQHDEALAEIEQAMAMDPNDPQLYDWMSNILWLMGKNKEAIESAKKGLQLDPNNPAMYLYRLARAYLMDGNHEESLQLLERVARISPELSGPVSIHKSIIYGIQDRNEEAHSAYGIFLKSRSSPVRNLNNILHYFPFSDPKMMDRIAEALIKAGVPGKLSDYYKIAKENRLTGKEVRSLLLGHRISGISLNLHKPYEWEWTKNGEFKYTGAIMDSGKSWVEGDVFINKFDKFLGGLPWGTIIYRNPEGSMESQNQYIMVSGTGTITPFAPME